MTPFVKVDLEKMNVMSRRAIDNADKRVRMLEVDLAKWQALAETEKKRVTEVRLATLALFCRSLTRTIQVCAFASGRGVYMRKLESALKVFEEELSRTKKEAEKKIKKLNSAVIPTSTREEALTQENEGLWVYVPCDLAREQTTNELFSENRKVHDVQARHARSRIDEMHAQ